MKASILIFLGILFSLQLFAKDAHHQIDIIIKRTMAEDGVLTKEIHQTFWSAVKEIGSEKKRQEDIKIIRDNIISMHEYQKEMWLSVQMSFNKKKIIKTKKLIEITQKLGRDFEKSLPYSKESKNYISVMNAYKIAIEASDKNLILLLDGAAKHKEVTISEGQILTIDRQFIERMLTGQSSSFERLSNLLDNTWTPSQ